MAIIHVDNAYVGAIPGNPLGSATNPFTTIAAALAAANASGDIIQVAAGTYTHTGQLTINKSVTIIGDGMGQTFIERSGSPAGNEERTVEVTASNVTFQDLSFTGWSNATTPANAGRGYLVWNTGDNNTYERVGFDSDSIRVAININSSDGITITDSSFTGDLYRYAIRGAGEHMEITNNVFKTSHYQGGQIYMEYGAPTSGVISGNTFEQSYGVSVVLSGGTSFQGDGSFAYTITNWQPNKITDDGLAITGNTFRFMNPDAVNENGYAPKVSAIYNDFLLPTSGPLTISNNTFEDYTFVPPPVDLADTEANSSFNNSSALVLDGAEQYGSFTLGDEIGEQGTLSFWIELDPTQLGRRHQILEGPGDGGLEFQYRYHSGGQFYATLNGAAGTYQISSGSQGTGNWVNVQYTWDLSSNSVKVYFNGVEASYAANQSTWTPLPTSNGTFYLGRDPGDASRMLDGKLDELVIFNRALTPAELQNVRDNFAALNTTTEASLVAAWNFENGVNGGVINSVGGTNVDITLHSIKEGLNSPSTIVVNGGADGVDIVGNTFKNSPPPQIAGNVNSSLNSVGPTEGDDIYYAISSPGSESIDGLGGRDTYDATGVDTGIVVHLTDGFSFADETGFDQLSNFENVRGGGGDDVLIGDANENVFFASGGHDFVDGRGDWDTLDASSGSEDQQVDFAAGSLTSDDFDTDFQNIEVVKTGSGNDTVKVAGGDNFVDGGAGNDRVLINHDEVRVAWDDVDETFVVDYGWANDVNDVDVQGDNGSVRVTGVETITLSTGQRIWLVTNDAEFASALTNAADDDVIQLAAGVYSDTHVVNVDVTIRGNNQGLSGSDGGRLVESVLEGGLYITAAGVTVTGVKVTGAVPFATGGTERDYGIVIAANDVTIENSVFDGAATTDTRPFGTYGVQNFSAHHNYVSGWGQGVQVSGSTTGDISDNVFVSNGNGIVTESSALQIHDNQFTDSVGSHIAVTGSANPLDVGSFVYDNDFTDPGAKPAPITIYANGGPGTVVNGSDVAEIFRGDYYSHSFEVHGGGGDDVLNGSSAGDTIEGGEGNDTIDGGGGKDTAAYGETLADGAIKATGTGWTVTQGNGDEDTLENVEIIDDSAAGRILLVGNGGYATINEALTDAVNGDTIMVGPGTYNEYLNITKSVTIIGSGDDTIINGNGSGSLVQINADGVTLKDVVLQNANYGIALGDENENFTLDGAKITDMTVGLRSASTVNFEGLTVSNTTFEDNGYGVYFANDGNGGSVKGVEFDDVVFNRNLNAAIYGEHLENATFTRITATDNATGAANGIVFDFPAYLAGTTMNNIKFDIFTIDNTGVSPAVAAFRFTSTGLATDGTNIQLLNGSIINVTRALQTSEPASSFTISNVAIGDLNGTFSWSGGPTLGPVKTIIAGDRGDSVLTGDRFSDADDDLIFGDYANTVSGNMTSPGNDSLSGGGGNDTIYGGFGTDTVHGGAGNDVLDGGESAGDNDVAVFDEAINNYTISYNGGTDTYTITKVGGGEIDTAKGFEILRFGGIDYAVAGNQNLVINSEVPVFNTPGNIVTSITENVANAFVTNAGATDADPSSVFGPVTYSLEGTDGQYFNIDTNGVVTFDGAADRETKASYSFTVRATQGITSSVKNVAVTVNDVNDNLPVFTSGATASVMEGTSATVVVYDADATDADAGFGPVSYSLAGADANAFTIDAVTGQVRLKTASDFETRNSYLFSVIASQGATSSGQAVTLTVLNQNEPISGLSDVTVQAEVGSTAKPLGVIANTGDGVVFQVQALNAGGGAVMNGNTVLAVGQSLTLAQLNALTFNAVADGFITLQATEGGNSDVLQVTLDVTPAVNGTLTGTSAADRLDGADGKDKILGKGGNDELLGGAGKDTIDGGKGNDTIYGGAGKDSIKGGKGDDVIYGGSGKDTLDGGAGADKFVFDTALGKADVIKGFVHGTDKIVLDAHIFAAVGGSLEAGEFRKNTTGKAEDANDRVIYETDTGKLYYDADGKGGAAAVHFATLDPSVSNLSRGDFEIV